MGPAVDHCFCFGDPLELFLAGKSADVPVMAGNTGDEFPAFLKADSKEEMREKARAVFGEYAEEFLKMPEAGRCDEEGRYGKVNGLECTIKGIFDSRTARGIGQKHYYYKFVADIPGYDRPGTFHSVDLWFFFETLAKCWRPFTGKHYDLARQMCNYWANFIKTGNPNGPDADQSPMPEWAPYEAGKPCEMIFSTQGAAAVLSRPESETEENAFMRFLIDASVRGLT